MIYYSSTTFRRAN